MSQRKKTVSVVLAILLALFLRYALPYFAVFAFFAAGFNDNYEITTDISDYQAVIGYDKWGMSEEIFPEKLTEATVTDFKHIYYNPWDANYLAYLVLEYDTEEAYEREIQRLTDCGITMYMGYYGVTGFTQYQLVAMNADSYNGFVYALTDGQRKVIYAELIFCNYYMDIQYQQQMPEEYLPDGFDATMDNAYQKKMQKSSGFTLFS